MFVKIASFQNKKQAEELRAKIILNGHNVLIKQVKINQDTYYRVITGPYNSEKGVLSAQKKIQQLGFKSIVLKKTIT